MDAECRHRTASILRAKGALPFGTSAAVASICASVFLNRGDVRPVSHYQPEFGCCFSLPAVLGRKGILRTVEVPLDEEETAQIARSAKRLRDLVDRVEAAQEASVRAHSK
jgi:L-lactate dehydrogenase